MTFFRTSLPSSEKNVYSSDLVEGSSAFKSSIRCIGCDVSRIQTIYQYLRLDIPALVYIKSVSVRYSSVIKGMCTVLPAYSFDMSTVENILKKPISSDPSLYADLNWIKRWLSITY